MLRALNHFLVSTRAVVMGSSSNKAVQDWLVTRCIAPSADGRQAINALAILLHTDASERGLAAFLDRPEWVTELTAYGTTSLHNSGGITHSHDSDVRAIFHFACLCLSSRRLERRWLGVDSYRGWGPCLDGDSDAKK